MTSLDGVRSSTKHSRPAPVTVVVVDDDVRVRLAVRGTFALEEDLLLVGEAADAASALAAAAKTDPAVVLVDVLLPDAPTGLALIRTLSGRPGCAVVAMSVRSDLHRQAHAAGAVNFVDKSQDIDALLLSVRAASARPA